MKYCIRLTLSICLCLSLYTLESQCSNTRLNPAPTIIASQYTDTITVTDEQVPGDYYVIENLAINESYQFSTSDINDYITIRNVYDPTILYAHGSSPLSYNVGAGPDIIAIHINLSSPSCGTLVTDPNDFRTSTVVCTTCDEDAPTVGVHTSNPQASLHVEGEIMVGDSGRPPQAGMIRWNEISKDFEGYNGEKWISLTKSIPESGWGTYSSKEANETQNIYSSDGASGDNFGESVSIDGDYAIVGAPFHDFGGNIDEGAAYVFHRSGTIWIEQAKLFASDGASDDNFGLSVSIDGDYAIIGSHRNDSGGKVDQGAAYVFHRSGTTWTEQAKLIPGDGGIDDDFGYSVSIKGNYAIVGAYLHDLGGNSNVGAAYVFHRSGTTWTEQAKLSASDGATFDRFGNSVSIDGDYAIVGAYLHDLGGNNNEGAAYVFHRSGTTWAEQAKLSANDGGAGDNFGYSVSINGNYVIVGSPNHDPEGVSSQGAAYIYFWTGATWSQRKITAYDGAEFDDFGYSVSIDGDYAIVGTPFHDLGGIGAGASYIFLRSGTTNWDQKVKLCADDGGRSDNFGKSVSINDGNVIVGSDLHDTNGNGNQGKAYIFEKN